MLLQDAWDKAVAELEADVDEKLEVQTIVAAKRAIVRVSGDAGLANVARLEAELTNVASNRLPLVIIDLTDLTFIASRGMGVLVSFHRRMSLQKGHVRVAAPKSRVRDALEIARLNTVLDMYESLEAALKGTATKAAE
jgi:anti-sigma B factor antagonist